MRSQTVALIGIGPELAHLRQRLVVSRVEQHPWGLLRVGRWVGTTVDVALVETAIGKVGAALGTQGVLWAEQPSLLINCGSAGALAPGLAQGDLVLASRVVAHDQGVYLPTQDGTLSAPGQGFVPTGSSLPAGRRRSFEPDPGLLLRVQAALRRRGTSALHVGPIVTGDQLILEDQRRHWLAQTFAALAVENEGVAVAQTAHCYGVPWLVLRGISDLANNAASFDYAPLLLHDEDTPPRRLTRVRHLVQHELNQPGTVRRLRQFRQGVKQAMLTVGVALDVLLPALSEGWHPPATADNGSELKAEPRAPDPPGHNPRSLGAQ